MKRLAKKTLKWTGIALLVLTPILLAVNAWFVSTTDARLEQQLAAIRAAGDPLTLADLKPKQIPPEKNAATYLRQAEADVKAIHEEIDQWIESQKQTDLWLYFSEKQPMPEKMHNAIKAIYAAHPNVIRVLQQASDCPDYGAPLDYSLPPGPFLNQILPLIQDFRSDERVLQYRVPSLLLDKNRDEAVRMALAIFRLVRHANRVPMLTGYLVAITIQGIGVDCANKALQAGPVSRELRQALDAELAIQERMEGYIPAIKSERAHGLDFFRRSIPLRNFWLFSRGRWNREESEYLDTMAAYIAMAPDRRPYHQSKLTVDKSTGQISLTSANFVELLLPSLDATHQAMMRVRAMIRCLRVLNALQTRVPPGSDAVPSLWNLGLPAETTFDPFTGKPLHVKRLPQGWLVYSVGPNQQDDGGKVDDPNPNTGDIGVGPPPATKSAEPAKK